MAKIAPDSVDAQIKEWASRLAVLPDIHADDYIFQFLATHPAFASIDEAIQRYFETGRTSARRFDELVSQFHPPSERPIDVLEFASGYGCVSRHLKSLGSKYAVVSCDIHHAAVDFLKERLGLRTALSASNPDQLDLGQRFGVVFALSFFSHMPHATWGRWFRKLLDLVAPSGLLIFTTHGRLSGVKFYGNPQLDQEGYWFRPESEQKDLSTQEYGSTIVAPRYVFAQCARSPDAHPVFFREGLWFNHQDTYVIQRGSEQQAYTN